MSKISVDVSEGIATITLNRPKSYNALTSEDYDDFANTLRELDQRDDVLVTVWQATGKWFCAGTDVKSGVIGSSGSKEASIRTGFLQGAARTTTDCGQALYSHRKILVAALNGPVMGIAAAFLGHFDFIYSTPDAWLSIPFSFLGIIAEGGSSVSFVNRMGLSQANEVLIWGKKKTAQQLLNSGFVNEIIPADSDVKFHTAVRTRIKDELSGLDPSALLHMKQLIRAGLGDKNNPDAVNLRESYAQAARFASGTPAIQFGRIARKEIKHKL